MGQDMHVGLVPGHHRAVHPDEISPNTHDPTLVLERFPGSFPDGVMMAPHTRNGNAHV
jgi:hypothetical protein